MVKIKNEYLEKFVEEHYDLLCNKFKFSIIKRISNDLNEYKSKRKDIYKEYILLLNYLNINLKNILIGKPKILEYHKKELIKLSKKFEFTKQEKLKTKEQKEEEEEDKEEDEDEEEEEEKGRRRKRRR